MKKLIAIILILILLVSAACSKIEPIDQTSSNITAAPTGEAKEKNKSKSENINTSGENLGKIELGIHNTTELMNLKMYQSNNPMESLPQYDCNSVKGWQIDLRSRDISKLDLTGRAYDLLHSIYNTETVWPKNLPDGFDPNKIMELNKTPGLNIKSLHDKGITGKGVGIAIIDNPLVLDHVEYKGKIKYYEHIKYPDNEAHFHGPLVASISVGNNIGVAPGSDLYFIANFSAEKIDGKFVSNLNYTVEAVKRLMEVNKILSQENKIRVLSISMAWEPEEKGYDELVEAIEEAREQGIFVVSCDLFNDNKQFYFHGLYKEALDDPNDFESYKPYSWEKWISMVKKPYYNFDTFYEEEYDRAKNKKILLIPMGGITAATATGNNHYDYFPDGGWSSAIPYIAGLYALTCQVKPDITPEEFWSAAYETGIVRTIEKDGNKHEARIPHPEELIKYLQK